MGGIFPAGGLLAVVGLVDDDPDPGLIPLPVEPDVSVTGAGVVAATLVVTFVLELGGAVLTPLAVSAQRKPTHVLV